MKNSASVAYSSLSLFPGPVTEFTLTTTPSLASLSYDSHGGICPTDIIFVRHLITELAGWPLSRAACSRIVDAGGVNTVAAVAQLGFIFTGS